MSAAPPDRLSQPEQLVDLFLYRLYRLQVTAGARVALLCEREYGLTRREWRILSSLSSEEGVPSSVLAEHAMLDRARTSRAITRLVDKGLLLRQPKPSDRREVRVHLTDEGRRVTAQLFAQVSAINLDVLAPLGKDERRTLDAMLTRLQARADGSSGSDAVGSAAGRD